MKQLASVLALITMLGAGFYAHARGMVEWPFWLGAMLAFVEIF